MFPVLRSVNSRPASYVLFAAETKRKIVEALQTAVEHPEYGPRFKKYGVTGFKHVDATFYDRVREAMEQSKNEKLYPAYY
jgi:hypothetical protein